MADTESDRHTEARKFSINQNHLICGNQHPKHTRAVPYLSATQGHLVSVLEVQASPLQLTDTTRLGCGMWSGRPRGGPVGVAFPFGTETQEESAGEPFLYLSWERTEPPLIPKALVNATHGACEEQEQSSWAICRCTQAAPRAQACWHQADTQMTWAVQAALGVVVAL